MISSLMRKVLWEKLWLTGLRVNYKKGAGIHKLSDVVCAINVLVREFLIDNLNLQL